jgi:hypothetical protein
LSCAVILEVQQHRGGTVREDNPNPGGPGTPGDDQRAWRDRQRELDRQERERKEQDKKDN